MFTMSSFEKFNDMLWKEYQEECKKLDNSYTIGTFGAWCFHKGRYSQNLNKESQDGV